MTYMADEIAITVGKYFQKEKVFCIPTYQRCYKWGVKGSSGKSCTEILIEDILNAQKHNRDTYFIQGVTVVEERDSEEIIIVDGQQRTTTLFLLFMYLREELKNIDLHEELEKQRFLFINNKSRLRYDVRKQTREYIDQLLELRNDIDLSYYEKEYQDCYYIRESLTQIEGLLSPINKKSFLAYLIEHVKLFYIKIDASKAPQIFSMLNGAKAHMTVEELVKAEMLNKISRESKHDTEWEINQRRGQYAREWDRWLYFWNRDDVKELFAAPKRPLGWLIEYFYHVETNDTPKWESTDTPTLFKMICDRFLSNPIEAKQTFYKLRNCQKHFEDLFSNPISYNYLGLAMQDHSHRINVIDKIKLFVQNYKDETILRRLAYLIILGATELEITEIINKEIINKVKNLIANLASKDVYNNFSEDTFLQLLRINIDKDNILTVNKIPGRKFNFSLYKERSLEHIHPKSKVYRVKEDGSYLQLNVDNPSVNLKDTDIEGWLCEQKLVHPTFRVIDCR